MKKFTKISLIVAAVLFALGLIITIAGAALGGTLVAARELAGASDWLFYNSAWHRGDHETTAYVAGEEAAAPSGDSVTASGNEALLGSHIQGVYDISDITRLEAEMTFGELSVETISGLEQIQVETNNIDSNFKCKLNGKTLEVEYNKNNPSKWLDGDEKPYIYILIPENMNFDKVELSLDAGYVYTSEVHADMLDVDVAAGQFDGVDFQINGKTKLEVDAGQISVTNLNTEDLEADCDFGAIDFSGSVSGDAKVKTGAGTINLNLDQNYSSFNYTLKCGVGQIYLNNESIGSLNAKRTIDNGASSDLAADCGVGEINISLYD